MTSSTPGAGRRRRFLTLLLGAAGALAAFGLGPATAAALVPNPDPDTIARWEPCEPDTGVTVMVSFDRLGDNKVHVGCALGNQPNGVAALENAGFSLVGTQTHGLGFICRINDFPTPAEEGCQHTPGADRYWVYLKGKPGGRWTYSGAGAATVGNEPKINSVEGWAFQGMPVEPMDARGPSAFTLPPAQESSVVPVAHASRWLQDVLAESVVKIEARELRADGDREWGWGLVEAMALELAGADPATFAPAAELAVSQSMGWANALVRIASPPVEPDAPDYWSYWDLERLPLLVMALRAGGLDPTEFKGVDLRGSLEEAIDPATGKIRTHNPPGMMRNLFGEWSVDDSTYGALTEKGPLSYAGVLRGLLATGGLPDGIEPTIDALLSKQDPDTGAFEPNASNVERNTFVIWALAELEEAGYTQVSESLQKVTEYMKSLQGEDGGIVTLPNTYPTVTATGFGALALSLAGEAEAAERAAKWVSRHQVTADYAGTPDPVSGEEPPAYQLIGSFFEHESELRNALAHGAVSNEYYLYGNAQFPTAAALLGLAAAGPYGPLYAELDQDSLFFDTQTVGSESGALAATLTSRDPRPVTIGAVELEGEGAGDFALGGDCAGRTLVSGESCELTARFAPAAVGLRQAVLRVELGGGEELGLSLAGTGSPAPDPGPGPDPDPEPGPGDPSPRGPGTAPPAPAVLLGPDAVVLRNGVQRLGGARVAGLASLSCPEVSGGCALRLPKRVRVKVGGRNYAAWVLAPTELAPGQSATLRVRLAKRAFARLGGASATVTVRVRLYAGGELRDQVVTGKVRRGA